MDVAKKYDGWQDLTSIHGSSRIEGISRLSAEDVVAGGDLLVASPMTREVASSVVEVD